MRWSVPVQRAADQENADAEQHPQTQTHKTETQCGTDRSVILRSLPLVQCGPARTSRCVEAASFYQLTRT
jgi:hypothetical protein